MNDETQCEFYSMWRDERESHNKTRLLRNVFFVWAIVATMLCAFLVWWAAGFTYVDPEEVITVTQDSEGINNYNVGTQGDVLNGASSNDR